MPQAGQRISEYVLDAPIGRGTFGEVWRARHHIWTDQFVAIKIPTDAQYLRALQREGTAIHGLVHPNIVRAVGFDPYAEPPYLVMEYVPGTSLRPLIAKRDLSVDDALSIMRQVLRGLQFAHSRGLVHRDIKPENILIHERFTDAGFAAEGVVKITDFGLGHVTAKTAVSSEIAYSASLDSPEARHIAGTLDYMSPEQRGGAETADHRADLYACGVVLYEMLTGERPAGAEMPSELRQSIPRHVDEAFRRSYARLGKRFNSAEEFLSALSESPSTPPRLHSTGNTMPCPRCRAVVQRADQFCMYCGVQLVTHIRRCSNCGAFPDASDRYCIFCGQTLTHATAQAKAET